MYCGDSSYFTLCCPKKLKSASEQLEVTPFKKAGNKIDTDSGAIEKGKYIQSRKV